MFFTDSFSLIIQQKISVENAQATTMRRFQQENWYAETHRSRFTFVAYGNENNDIAASHLAVSRTPTMPVPSSATGRRSSIARRAAFALERLSFPATDQVFAYAATHHVVTDVMAIFNGIEVVTASGNENTDAAAGHLEVHPLPSMRVPRIPTMPVPSSATASNSGLRRSGNAGFHQRTSTQQ